MKNQSIDLKPSETALMAAIRRDLASRMYNKSPLGPDYLAKIFLPANVRFLFRFKGMRNFSLRRLETGLPGLQSFMIARTRFFDRLFLQALEKDMPQIVMMGAGYDTRPYRFAGQNTKTRIFELDSAPTQDHKRKCLQRANIRIPETVSFIPINFNQQTLADALEEAGYDHDRETLFLWEGVSYYLEAKSVDLTLKYVCQAHPESAVAFDYTITVNQETMDQYYGARGFYDAMAKHHAGEALLFSLPEDTLGAFLKDRGLKVLQHLSAEDIEADCLREDAVPAPGPITGHFHFAVAAPE